MPLPLFCHHFIILLVVIVILFMLLWCSLPSPSSYDLHFMFLVILVLIFLLLQAPFHRFHLVIMFSSSWSLTFGSFSCGRLHTIAFVLGSSFHSFGHCCPSLLIVKVFPIITFVL
jgi:hypothetical protein